MKTKNSGTTQRVYDAVCELRNLEQTATRETVAELTGLKLVTVDDRLRDLVDEGKLRRVLRGVYEVIHNHPPARPMSKSILSDGTVKIEIGDDVLTLTPREDRALAQLMVGASFQAAAVGAAHAGAANQSSYMLEEMSARLRKLEQAAKKSASGSGG